MSTNEFNPYELYDEDDLLNMLQSQDVNDDNNKVKNEAYREMMRRQNEGNKNSQGKNKKRKVTTNKENSSSSSSSSSQSSSQSSSSSSPPSSSPSSPSSSSSTTSSPLRSPKAKQSVEEYKETIKKKRPFRKINIIGEFDFNDPDNDDYNALQTLGRTQDEIDYQNQLINKMQQQEGKGKKKGKKTYKKKGRKSYKKKGKKSYKKKGKKSKKKSNKKKK
jgi:hypothetical protein